MERGKNILIYMRILIKQFEEKESHFVESFCEFCSHKKCVPDFLSIQVYPQQTVSLSYNRDSFFRSEPQIKREDFAISEDSDAFKNILLHFAEKFGKQYKIYLTEFNADAWSRNLCHDTCYTTAFITKSILENMDEVESFAYWTLSDFMEEMPIGKGPFFGNFGLFTHNSIPKPGLQAFRLLTFLENIEIARGPGYYVTKGDGKIQIMLYNYCHFDQQFCNRITWAITTTERYQVFNSKKLEIELELENLKEGQHNITYQYVNRENGSVFDAWVKLDGPEYLSAADTEYLRQASVIPMIRKSIFTDISGKLHLERILEPHEICLIEVDNAY